MTRNIGLWIDHHQAVIVALTDHAVETYSVKSDVERHIRVAGGARSKTAYGPQDVSDEPQRERKFANELDHYYDKVSAYLTDADRIFLLGLGEAKIELKQHLADHHMGDRIAGVETADKMTDAQVIAAVRQHFAREIPRKHRAHRGLSHA